jgi:glycosyltransferase involved in cell wall biosynthesis
MKNILFLEQFSKLSGGQFVLLSIIDGLNRSIINPIVVLPEIGDLSKELDKRRVEYVCLPIGEYSAGKKPWTEIIKMLFSSFWLTFLVVRLIKAKKIQVVYANAPRTFLWGTLAAKLAGVLVVWHIHSLLSGLELKLCKVLQKHVAKIICVSECVAKPFRQLQEAAQIEVVYNGIDVDKYTRPSQTGKLKSELRVGPQLRVVGFIGQIAEWKGVADFIEAANLISKTEDQVLFVVIGEALFGKSRQITYKDQLRQRVKELGLEKVVLFLGGRIDIPDVLAGIDILVLPSRTPDPCPLVLLEAMAAGKAIITAKHGGPAEIIKEDQTGRFFLPGNVFELSQSIQSLLNAPDQVIRLGKNAQIAAKEAYSLGEFQGNISKIINGLF